MPARGHHRGHRGGHLTALTAAATSRGLVVVAEGVETESAAQVLVDEGCHRAQGFLFCEPVDAESTRRLLAEGSVPVRIEPTAP
ncbi:EAL domain-containing protein [Mycobacterium sp. 050134]|uniref:EAL domain-containing protein n=1 Tax=Mycobacterium sp. 050134 TaxID=3096111 RepID=UPI002ED8610C